MGMKFSTEEGNEGPLLHAKFHPAYPLRDFHKISRVCTPFQDALAVKISLDSLKRLWSYGGFKLTVSGYPKIFSVP